MALAAAAAAFLAGSSATAAPNAIAASNMWDSVDRLDLTVEQHPFVVLIISRNFQRYAAIRRSVRSHHPPSEANLLAMLERNRRESRRELNGVLSVRQWDEWNHIQDQLENEALGAAKL
jgi:hypothetical protein